jgi:hypothetical protein
VLSSNKSLIVRAEPNTDESFGGYMIRLTELNRYNTTSTILKLAGIERKFLDGGYSLLFRDSFDLTPLARLTDANITKLRLLTYPSTKRQESSRTVSIFGLPIHRNHVRVRFPKICPACLKESPYCRKAWDLTAVTACPIHKILLIDKCPGCNKRITWVRSRTTGCRCDFNWAEAASSKVEQTDLAFIRRIYQLCDLSSDEEQLLEPNENPALRLDLDHLLRAVYFIARQYRNDIHRNGGYFSSFSIAELHSLLSRSFSVFNYWPDNFHTLLNQVRTQENGGRTFRGLTNEFGYFYRNLYVNIRSKQFDFMRDEFEEYVYKNWYGSWVFNRNRLKGTSTYRRYISKADAMRQLGLHQRCIERLIKLGKFKVKESSPGARAGVLVDAEDVTRFKIGLRHSLTLTDAARLLGTKSKTVSDLAGRGHIEAIRGPRVDGSQAWRFTRESLDGFLDSLYNLCLSEESIEAQGLVSFHSALTMFVGCEIEASTLIEAIFEKKIVPYRNDGSVGISGLLFRREQIYEYAQTLRRTRRQGYCIKDLVQVLGFSTNSPILFLVRKGVIEARKSLSNPKSEWLISQKEVDSFKAKYVLASQIAKESGTSGAFLSELLMSNGITPVSGPKADGGKQYVFRKIDLKKINLVELVSKARLEEKRKNKKTEIIDSVLTKKILGVNSQELLQLIDCGVLNPSRSKQRKENGEYVFNLFHVERLKSSSIDYLNLISLPETAKTLGETYSALQTNWIKSAHLKIACRYNDKIFLSLADVRAVLKLKEKTFTVTEAATSLGVSPKAVLEFVSSGSLKLAHKSNPKGEGRTLFWRKDVEKLRGRLCQ